jgi:hypothetical protein
VSRSSDKLLEAETIAVKPQPVSPVIAAVPIIPGIYVVVALAVCVASVLYLRTSREKYRKIAADAGEVIGLLPGDIPTTEEQLFQAISQMISASGGVLNETAARHKDRGLKG